MRKKSAWKPETLDLFLEFWILGKKTRLIRYIPILPCQMYVVFLTCQFISSLVSIGEKVKERNLDLNSQRKRQPPLFPRLSTRRWEPSEQSFKSRLSDAKQIPGTRNEWLRNKGCKGCERNQTRNKGFSMSDGHHSVIAFMLYKTTLGVTSAWHAERGKKAPFSLIPFLFPLFLLPSLSLRFSSPHFQPQVKYILFDYPFLLLLLPLPFLPFFPCVCVWHVVMCP